MKLCPTMKKMGGTIKSYTQMNTFKTIIDECVLSDLLWKWDFFTLFNKRRGIILSLRACILIAPTSLRRCFIHSQRLPILNSMDMITKPSSKPLSWWIYQHTTTSEEIFLWTQMVPWRSTLPSTELKVFKQNRGCPNKIKHSLRKDQKISESEIQSHEAKN